MTLLGADVPDGPPKHVPSIQLRVRQVCLAARVDPVHDRAVEELALRFAGPGGGVTKAHEREGHGGVRLPTALRAHPAGERPRELAMVLESRGEAFGAERPNDP